MVFKSVNNPIKVYSHLNIHSMTQSDISSRHFSLLIFAKIIYSLGHETREFEPAEEC